MSTTDLQRETEAKARQELAEAAQRYRAAVRALDNARADLGASANFLASVLRPPGVDARRMPTRRIAIFVTLDALKTDVRERDLVEILGMTSIGGQMTKMVRAGEVERVERGVYRVGVWQDGEE